MGDEQSHSLHVSRTVPERSHQLMPAKIIDSWPDLIRSVEYFDFIFSYFTVNYRIAESQQILSIQFSLVSVSSSKFEFKNRRILRHY
jgi:membrane protein CcdC involved in cytochrome C biogenesis